MNEPTSLLVQRARQGDADAFGELTRRGPKFHHFLTQPVYVGEPYTNVPGTSVTLADTLEACRRILDAEAT